MPLGNMSALNILVALRKPCNKFGSSSAGPSKRGSGSGRNGPLLLRLCMLKFDYAVMLLESELDF